MVLNSKSGKWPRPIPTSQNKNEHHYYKGNIVLSKKINEFVVYKCIADHWGGSFIDFRFSFDREFELKNKIENIVKDMILDRKVIRKLKLVEANDFFEEILDYEFSDVYNKFNNLEGIDIIYKLTQGDDGNLYGEELYTHYLFPIFNKSNVRHDYCLNLSDDIDDDINKNKKIIEELIYNNTRLYINLIATSKLRPGIGSIIVRSREANKKEVQNYLKKYNDFLIGPIKGQRFKEKLHHLYLMNNYKVEKKEEIYHEENKVPASIELQNPGNTIKLIQEIEYNLSKLKDIDSFLCLKFKEEYEEYLKTNNTSIAILGNLNGRIQAEIISKKERPIDIINYLNNLKLEYINNFINDSSKKTQMDLNKLDKINELFLKKQNDYTMVDRVKVLNDLAFVYFLEVYENIDIISINELEQSYFKQHLSKIVTIIKALEELKIIKCSYFVSLVDELNIKVVLDMIKNIEFIKVKEETMVKVLKTL